MTYLRVYSGRYAGRDSTGAQSPVYVVDVVICTGCTDRGSCNYDVLRKGDEYFHVATCDCLPYYSGTQG